MFTLTVDIEKKTIHTFQNIHQQTLFAKFHENLTSPGELIQF